MLEWKRHSQTRADVSVPSELVSAVELVLDAKHGIVESDRSVGSNDIGMVAWRITALA